MVYTPEGNSIPCPQCIDLVPPPPPPLPPSPEPAEEFPFTCTHCGSHNPTYVTVGDFFEKHVLVADEEGAEVLWIDEDTMALDHGDTHDSWIECGSCGAQGHLSGDWSYEWP